MAQMGLTGGDLGFDFDSRDQQYLRNQAWQMPMEQHPSQKVDMRRAVTPIQTNTHGLPQSTLAEQHILGDWRFQQPQSHMNYTQPQQPTDMQYHAFYGMSLQTSPSDLMPVTQAPLNTGLQLDNSYMPMAAALNGTVPYNWEEFQSELISSATTDAG